MHNNIENSYYAARMISSGVVQKMSNIYYSSQVCGDFQSNFLLLSHTLCFSVSITHCVSLSLSWWRLCDQSETNSKPKAIFATRLVSGFRLCFNSCQFSSFSNRGDRPWKQSLCVPVWLMTNGIWSHSRTRQEADSREKDIFLNLKVSLFVLYRYGHFTYGHSHYKFCIISNTTKSISWEKICALCGQ